MAWAPLLLTLLAHCTGSASQKEVIQEPTLSTTPGGTVTLTCGFSIGDVTNLDSVIWIQQNYPQEPRGLLHGANSRAPGVPDRFSGSLFGNKAALTITGAQAEDEAEYYCVMYFSNQSHYDRCRLEKVLRDNIPAQEPKETSPVSVSTMAWMVFLLALLIHGSGTNSQTVTQESKVSVSLGERVTLSCGLDSGPVTKDHYSNWYQQIPGQPPLRLIYWTDSRPSAVPDRFSGSISENKATLTITGGQLEDEADYYCALYMDSDTLTVV
ncbi:uncharacterized protein LOC107522830 [Erinaceus europaeus]|uniref:Uncharacterized protein LOC107522830 n=1 Tax=Erinaceus europaeus TaxID=9365 RepID=A0ABM3XIK5_ERIEU|nr:uncharacterized protein LOC107522830 [Erinaceus europaeus]